MLSILLFGSSHLSGQRSKASFTEEVSVWRTQQNTFFKNPDTSPLSEADQTGFDVLDFYRPRSKYRVKATIRPTPESKPFEMPTTTSRRPMYVQYGIISFKLRGKVHNVPIYKNLEYSRNPLYRNKLFFPFKDKTNGKKSYGAGRYIDVDLQGDDSLILDFNKAYNPYCAYNKKYSCPIVPRENHLPVKIKAGVKKYL